MGASQSTSLTAVNNIVNKNVRNIAATKIGSNTTTVSIEILQSVDISQLTCEGDLNILASGEITLNQMNEFTDNDTTELVNSVLNDLSSSMDSLTELVTEMGTYSISNQETDQLIMNEIQNVLETNITKETINSSMISANVVIDQNVIAEVINITGNCNITADAVIDANVQNITNLITSTIVNDSQVNKIINEQASKQKAELTGLATLVESVMSGWGAFIILGAILIFALLGVPTTGGIAGGRKGFAIACCVGILLIGIYLLIDFLVLRGKLAKYSLFNSSDVKVHPSQSIEDNCPAEWYDKDVQNLLYDTYQIEQKYTNSDGTVDEEAVFLEVAKKYDMMLKNYACYGTDANKVKAYNKLYKCLASKGLLEGESGVATTNVFTGCTKDEYLSQSCTEEKENTHLAETCQLNQCASCIA